MFKRLKRLFKSEEQIKQELKDELMKEIRPKMGSLEPINVSETIDNWKQHVSLLEEHPLSQARVVNTNMLQNLSDVMNSMDKKLAHLERLEKLDEILKLLKQEETLVKQEKQQKEQEKAEKKEEIFEDPIKFALTKVEYLTLKDRQFLETIDEKQPLDAEEMADYMGCSRSTASYRMNRLSNMGILKKEVRGKKIFFKINRD